jgi:DNA-directed RNA polymerase subunit F
MANYKIKSTEAISGAEVLEIVNGIEAERESTYRENRIKEYLNKTVKLSADDIKSAKEEIEQLQIPRLDENHIIKILEILPKNGTELRAIVSHSGTVLVDESVTKIMDVLAKYR